MEVVSGVGYVPTANVVYVTRLCQTAGATVVLYDHIISLDREVDHVWSHPFCLGSISYLLIRYIGDGLALLNLITFLEPQTPEQRTTLHSCKVYFFVQSWLGLSEIFITQVVLQARLYALYHASRTILAIMIVGYACEIAAMATIMGFVDAYAQSTNTVSNEILPGMPICADVQGPSFYQLYIFWLPIIVYDSTLFLMVLWHEIGSWISGYHLRRVRHRVRVADTLIRGSAGYSLCIILTCIINIVIGQYLGIRWTQVSEAFPAPMQVVIGCRLILNLRSSLMDHDETAGRTRDEIPWLALVPLSTTSPMD